MKKIYAEWYINGNFDNRFFSSWDEYYAFTFNPNVGVKEIRIIRSVIGGGMMPEQKHLIGKYAKLAEDLRVALAAGQAAEAENPEDGGTCNFDSPALFLPHWNYGMIEQASREAGCRCYEWKLFGSKMIVFTPDSGAQANARSRNAEAMCEELKSRGYDAKMYYQMD